ncbi:MAG: methylornithine synthase PylB [Clostridiaceae bacterium]|jgi:methylornithine synthase|nr:methylornithine synthase PylB [Clostridiaceae bacterium]
MLKDILNKCMNNQTVAPEEILYLLDRTDEADEQLIFQAARETCRHVFADKIFLYGFVYFSTYCKNNCTFCFYRKDNHKPPRYRKTSSEVLDTVRELQVSGVHLIDLTTGDDPFFTMNPELLGNIVKAVKDESGLAVMVSPGVLDQKGLETIKEAGADWYALYQETHNRTLYARLRLDQSYDTRMAAKKAAAKLGLLIEEGLLTGVGDTHLDCVHSFEVMKSLNASQVRTMTFIPQEGTPYSGSPEPDYRNELRNISVMRLLFPDALIPASLDVEGLQGLEKRLLAGANVVTSIIPPQKGLAGVATCEAGIDEGYRTVAGIQDIFKKCGVRNATKQEYDDWLVQRKNSLRN